MHATCRPSWVVLETISGHVRFIKRIPTNQQPSKKIFTTHSTSQTSSRSQIKRQEPWTMTATVFSRKQILTDRTLYMKNNNTHQNHPSSGVTITSCDNGRKKMSHSFSSSQGGGWEWKTSGRNHTSNHAQQTFLEHPALQIGVWVCIYKTKQTHQGGPGQGQDKSVVTSARIPPDGETKQTAKTAALWQPTQHRNENWC